MTIRERRLPWTSLTPIDATTIFGASPISWTVTFYEGNETYERQHEDFGPGEGRWKVPPVIEELKGKAKAEGLWNMFHPDPKFGPGPFQCGLCADRRTHRPLPHRA